LIQKTPISMTVVTGEQLSRLGVVDLERASPLLPGLKLVSTAFGRRLVLRGVYGAGEATTGLYYDETLDDRPGRHHRRPRRHGP
jgi:iron complex outermembrane receptor protein